MMVKAGFALLDSGEGFKLAEKVCVEVDGGVISSISSWAACPQADHVVGGEWLLVMPQPANAHIHSGDFAFPEYGIDLKLEEAVAPPKGLKHRLLSRTSFDRLVEAVRSVYLSSWRRGVGLLVDFREGGGVGCLAAREALAAVEGMRVVILGRPGPRWPEGCDGLGVSSPLDYDFDFLKSLVGSSRLSATHVAETPRARELGDLERAVEAGFKVLVHGVHLKSGDFDLLREKGIALILCPRSNLWHGLGLPRIAEAYHSGVTVGLGSDNAAWFTPDPWEEAKILIYLSRLLGLKKEAPEIALNALFKGGYEAFGERPSVIVEGAEARLVLARVPEGLQLSLNKLYALLKRIESRHLIARVDGSRLSPLVGPDSRPYQALHRLASSGS